MFPQHPGYGSGMTGNAAGDSAAASHTAAALQDIQPYVATVAAVALLGAPAEIAVPIVRRVRGRSGVSIGPSGTTLLNGIVALGVAHWFRQRPARWQRVRQTGVPSWAGIGLLVHLTLSPAVAARWQGGVVLRRRSPLWGALVSPTGLLQLLLVLVALVRARQAQVRGRRPPERPTGTR